MKRLETLGLAVVVVMAMALCGCATLGGQSDEELIAATINLWKSSLETQDLEMMMAQISEDFEGEAGGKEEVKALLSGAIDQGYLDDAEVDLVDAETTIEGETASVYGLYVETAMGSASMDLELKKDADGVWRIVGMDVIT